MDKVESISRAQLQPNDYNNRKNFDPDKLAELARSMREHGVLQFLLVRPVEAAGEPRPRFEIVSGERRWRAAEIAELAELPCVVREMSDNAALECCVIENLQREGLTPLEEAEGFRRLREDAGLEVPDICERVGVKKTVIYERLKLLELDAAGRKALEAGSITPRVAIPLLQVREESVRARALDEVRGMSVREATDYLDREYLAEQRQEDYWQEGKQRRENEDEAAEDPGWQAARRLGEDPRYRPLAREIPNAPAGVTWGKLAEELEVPRVWVVLQDGDEWQEELRVNAAEVEKRERARCELAGEPCAIFGGGVPGAGAGG